MESIRVAAVSMNSELGKRNETLRCIEQFCERAVAQRAELVVFPELIVHGHCTPNTWEIAEPVPAGESVEKLTSIARRSGIFLSAGMSEKENDIVYNTQVLIGPNGYLGKQRKLHMSRDESFFYKGGREIRVFDIGKCKVGIVICYDNQFPEVGRIVALQGADVILMPHAAREGRWEDTPESESAARRKVFDFFASSYRMRARENACFCVYADQAGRAGYVDSLPREHFNQPHHPGGAMVIGPNGDILRHTQTEQIRDEMIVADLDASLLAKARSHPNYTLRTRRPELFGELTRDQVRS
jgi:N-carbamoylputrescine amidase